MTLFKRLILAASTAATLLFSATGSHAVVIAGNYGPNGYSVVNLTTSGGNVDMLFNSGYGDATFSLFNSAGSHLVTNDDANSSLNPHLTQTLGAGNYSLLISYCCTLLNEVQSNGGAALVFTDGFNSGTYWFGGSSTLSSVENYLTNISFNISQETFNITVTNASEGTNSVPEPGSMALMGLALAALGVRRKGLAK